MDLISGIEIGAAHAEVTRERAERLLEDGVEHVVVRVWPGDATHARRRLEVLSASKLSLGLAVPCAPTTQEPDAFARRTTKEYERHPPHVYWLDLLHSDGVTYANPAQNVAWLRRVLVGFRETDVKVGLNVSRIVWQQSYGASREFADSALWLADERDGVPSLEVVPAFAGWTVARGREYAQSSGPVGGWHPLVLSVFDRAWVEEGWEFTGEEKPKEEKPRTERPAARRK